jgi:hypothetical protein
VELVQAPNNSLQMGMVIALVRGSRLQGDAWLR